MNKDGNRGSDSTVVLMTVAVAYKFILVLIGAGILLFWYAPLHAELGRYFPLYLLGLLLNVVLVALILGVMLFPKVILHLALLFEGLFIRMRIWKPSDKREEKINAFIDSYQQAVTWLRGHRGSLVLVLLVTFLQRCSVFVLTYMVYLGFGLHGAGAMRVILLQAAVYIAVDMLPLPGAQGITELMYQAVFVHVFYGGLPDPFHDGEPGDQFLFSAGRKPCGGGRQSVGGARTPGVRASVQVRNKILKPSVWCGTIHLAARAAKCIEDPGNAREMREDG